MSAALPADNSFSQQDSIQAAKAELAKNPQDLIALIDKCIIGICVTAGNGVFIHANQAYLQIYGYTQEELIGHHFTLMAPSEDRHEVWQAIYDAFIEDGEEMAGEWVVKSKDGRLLTIYTDAVRIGNEQDGYQKATFVNDITDLRTLQRDFAELRHRFSALIQQPFLPLILIDPRSEQVILANKAFVDHVELTPDQVQNARLTQLLSPVEGTWASWLEHAHGKIDGIPVSLQSRKGDNSTIKGHLRIVSQDGIEEAVLALKV